MAMEALPAAAGLQKMKSYLGCEPESDARGVLQDVHWSAGAPRPACGCLRWPALCIAVPPPVPAAAGCLASHACCLPVPASLWAAHLRASGR